MTGREIFSPPIDVPTPREMLVPSTDNKSRKTTQRVSDPRERETGKLNKVHKYGGQRSGRSRFTGSQGSQPRSSGRADKKRIQPKQNLCE